MVSARNLQSPQTPRIRVGRWSRVRRSDINEPGRQRGEGAANQRIRSFFGQLLRKRMEANRVSTMKLPPEVVVRKQHRLHLRIPIRMFLHETSHPHLLRVTTWRLTSASARFSTLPSQTHSLLHQEATTDTDHARPTTSMTRIAGLLSLGIKSNIVVRQLVTP